MRTVVRALAAGAVAGGALLGSAGPAWAAAPVVDWRAPTADQRFDVADLTVDATVKMPNNGTLRGTATLSFTSPEGHPVPAPLDVATGNQATKVITHAVSLPWNGPYTAHIRATGRDGALDTTDETATHSVNVLLDAPPATPADVRTTIDSEARTVTVTWTANGEPDMVGYEVQRQVGTQAWEQLTLTGRSTTTVVDDSPSSTGGTYRYRVVAFRESGTPGQGMASDPSATSTAQVAPPPTTTTTTAPDDDDGGGTDGGTTGGTTGGTNRTPRTGTTDGSTTTTGSTGRTGSGSSARSAPLLATRGKVDLSGFAQLLEQARAAGAHAADRAEEADGGYSERLPFSPRTTVVRTGSEAAEEQALVGEPIGDGDNRLQSMAFVAGGLLATVLLMHVLWVRAELRRADELEALAPEGDVPAGGDGATADADPWSRHLAAALARFHARPPVRRPGATPTAARGVEVAAEDESERVVIG